MSRSNPHDDSKFLILLASAMAAGEAAALSAIPSPMCVSNGGELVAVSIHGECGGARVVVKDRRTRFARWLLASRCGEYDECVRGVCFYAPNPTQSAVRALAFAEAAARVLREAGVRAASQSLRD